MEPKRERKARGEIEEHDSVLDAAVKNSEG